VYVIQLYQNGNETKPKNTRAKADLCAWEQLITVINYTL